MPQQDILKVGIRVGALVVFLNLLIQAPAYFSTFGILRLNDTGELTRILSVMIPWLLSATFAGLICVFLWFKPQLIMPKNISASTSTSDGKNGSYEDLHFTLVSAIGLYFLATGFMQIINQLTILAFAGISINNNIELAKTTFFMSTVIRMCIGLFMIVSTGTIIRAIRRARQY